MTGFSPHHSRGFCKQRPHRVRPLGLGRDPGQWGQTIQTGHQGRPRDEGVLVGVRWWGKGAEDHAPQDAQTWGPPRLSTPAASEVGPPGATCPRPGLLHECPQGGPASPVLGQSNVQSEGRLEATGGHTSEAAQRASTPTERHPATAAASDVQMESQARTAKPKRRRRLRLTEILR